MSSLQTFPRQPSLQEHLNFSLLTTLQVAPFLQGLGPQGVGVQNCDLSIFVTSTFRLIKSWINCCKEHCNNRFKNEVSFQSDIFQQLKTSEKA